MEKNIKKVGSSGYVVHHTSHNLNSVTPIFMNIRHSDDKFDDSEQKVPVWKVNSIREDTLVQRKLRKGVDILPSLIIVKLKHID